MSVIKRLESLNLQPESKVTLTYSAGVDVFVHNETEVDTALSETDVVHAFAELVATPGLRASTQYGGDILESLRSEGYLEEYERDGSFGMYLNDVISENFYDVDLIEYSTEKYDHKRGFCTLTAQVQVTVDNIMTYNPFLSGWTVSVNTDNGTLSFDA